MSDIFWVFAGFSMLGYSIMSTLNAHYVRTINDPFSSGFYRSFSLIFSLSPLLFLVDFSAVLPLSAWGWKMFGCAFFASLAQVFKFLALMILPVGVQNAVTMSFNTIFVLTLSIVFLNEHIAPITFFPIGVILLGVVFLALQKNKMDHLDYEKMGIGFLLTVSSSVVFAISIVWLTQLIRANDAVFMGYLWEVSIAIFAGIFLVIRKIHKPKTNLIKRINRKTFLRIFLVNAFTFLGTGGFALATKMGPVSIVFTIGVAGLAVSTLLAHYLFREKLSVIQWVSIFTVMAGISMVYLIT